MLRLYVQKQIKLLWVVLMHDDHFNAKWKNDINKLFAQESELFY